LDSRFSQAAKTEEGKAVLCLTSGGHISCLIKYCAMKTHWGVDV